MVLTPEQLLQIASAYESDAADKLGVPLPQRAAFARKAQGFLMLARRGVKKSAVSAASERRLTQGSSEIDSA